MVGVESGHVTLAVASGGWTFVGICRNRGEREREKNITWYYHHGDVHVPYSFAHE